MGRRECLTSLSSGSTLLVGRLVWQLEPPTGSRRPGRRLGQRSRSSSATAFPRCSPRSSPLHCRRRDLGKSTFGGPSASSVSVLVSGAALAASPGTRNSVPVSTCGVTTTTRTRSSGGHRKRCRRGIGTSDRQDRLSALRLLLPGDQTDAPESHHRSRGATTSPRRAGLDSPGRR